MRLLSCRERKRLTWSLPLSAVPFFCCTFCIRIRDLRLFTRWFWGEDVAVEGAAGTFAEASMLFRCV